jgi:ATP-dependent Clp protease ATP-binding subunit ClpX
MDTGDQAGRGHLPRRASEVSREEIVRFLSPKDLMEFGMIPEFIGRLPVVTTLDKLERDDLVRILTEPRNSLVRQYQGLFAMEGAELHFTPDALESIADISLERETGVRALRSILEELLLDLLYELPNRKDTREFTVDAAVVCGETSLARGLVADDLEDDDSDDESGEDSTGEDESEVERESA